MLEGTLLVTGSTGFLGSEVCRQAVHLGASLRTTARSAETRLAAEAYNADIRNVSELDAPMAGVRSVIHCAGLAHVHERTAHSTELFQAANAQGTANVARAAVRAGVQHLVIVSSVAVYGEQTTAISIDESSVCTPSDPYAISKLDAERLAARIVGDTGTKLTILRMATVYGEGDRGNVARLIRALDRYHVPWIGCSQNKKSLIHREDAGRACLQAVIRHSSGNEVFNVSAYSCSMRHIVEEISSALRKQLSIVHIPRRAAVLGAGVLSTLLSDNSALAKVPKMIRKWVSDDAYSGCKFNAAFQFQPTIDLCSGIAREVAWIRASS